MNSIAKDAERVRRPKLPKNKPFKKLKKSSKRVHDGGDEVKSKRASGSRRVLFCPRCGSNNIFWASGLPHLWSIWECRNCGYRGTFVVRDGKLAEKVREDYAKKTAVQ
jgi:predicted RNA-binding Zn-ribbon protein involved in translation (DUF1610 family)